MQLKKKGDIHHIGFSSHKTDIALKAIETGIPEIMMFSINLAFDLSNPNSNNLDSLGTGWQSDELNKMDFERAALYTLCEQKGIGISVMKTLGAGKLISPNHTPFSKPMTVNQCIHYALSRPGVYSTLIGCENKNQVINTLKYLNTDEREKDYALFLDELNTDFIGKCVYCNHCLPCPSGIDIAMVNKYLDIAKLDEKNIPPSIYSHYHSLANGGDTCISCGSCETRCPFGVPVIENMRKAAELFK